MNGGGRGPYLVGRGVHVNEAVREKVDGADEAAKDLNGQSNTLVVLWRAYRNPSDAAYVQEVILTKSSGSGGFVSGYIPAFATAIPRLICEVVLKDTAVTDAGTPSGKGERVLARWATAVVDAAT